MPQKQVETTNALLKDQVDQKFVHALCTEIEKHVQNFDRKTFFALLTGQKAWADLALKSRIREVARALHDCILLPYPNQIEILKKVIPYTKGLGNLAFPDFVEMYGQGHWDISVQALADFTRFFSSEYAVRPFIEKDEKKMLAVMVGWSTHPDEHIRRLSSEGCRPRLPWSFPLKRFIRDPSPILPILENLKADSSLYVRKSVANNINDISKDHPTLVLKLAKKWLGKNERTDWIVKHGLRTLLKKGNVEALELFKFQKPKGVAVTDLQVAKNKCKIGSHLEFSFQVQCRKPQKLRIEYGVHYLKKNGGYSKKVFKITEIEVAAPTSKKVVRRHSLRQMTTRKHYPGEHHLEIQINGVSMEKETFFVFP